MRVRSPGLRSRIPRAAATAACMPLALLLAGCLTGDGKRAGVDEFPNSVYARVNGFLDESRKSEEIGAPALGDSLSLGTGIPVAAESAAVRAARKVSAAAGNSAWRGIPAGAGAFGKRAAAGCTAGSLTTSQRRDADQTSGDTLYVADSTTLCLDAKALDDIPGNETILRLKHVAAFTDGRIETAEISDADGDGILNPVPGAAAKAALILSAFEDGVLERTELIAGPGPDGDFDSEADNLVYSAFWSRTADGDTLARASYADGDGDGAAIDNGKPSAVDLDLYQKGPTADHPDAVWSRTRLRMVVRYHEDAKQVRKLRFDMEDGAGRISAAEVRALDGSEEFDMRDTVVARFTTAGTAESDSLDTLDVRLTMGLGADFDSKADDSVYALRVASTRKLGDERSAGFAFVSSRPIPSGGRPEDGTLSMSIEYADGSRLSVEGVLAEKSLDVTVEDREGRRAHVIWDQAGKGILYERLP